MCLMFVLCFCLIVLGGYDAGLAISCCLNWFGLFPWLGFGCFVGL